MPPVCAKKGPGELSSITTQVRLIESDVMWVPHAAMVSDVKGATDADVVQTRHLLTIHSESSHAYLARSLAI